MGEIAKIDLQSNTIPSENADIYLATAWKDGKTVYYRKTLGNIAQSLSQKFNVKIRFANDDLRHDKYTATFTTEGITEILDLLKMTAPIDYTITTTGTVDDPNRIREILIYQK